MPLIAHRGAAGLSTANSLASIKEAAKYYPDYIEIDINCTADGILVIHHGSMMRFMRGRRETETYAELMVKHPTLMTVDEFFSKPLNHSFMFDIKVSEDELLEIIIKAVHGLGPQQFAFTSPHEKALISMKKAFPNALIFQSQPYHHGPVAAVEIARKHRFEGIALNKWWMTPLVYRLCKLYGKKLMCYTVDSKIGIKLIVKFFPDVYVVTNRPDIYRQMFPISSK